MSDNRNKHGLLITVSPIYANVNKEFGEEWYDLEKFIPKWNSPTPYIIQKKVGRGKFSTVYLAFGPKRKKCAIKILVPANISRYYKEIKILMNLHGHKNIVQLYDLVIDPISLTYSFVFEWVENHDYKSLYRKFSLDDIRHYMKQLLEGINYAHSHGIIHRDIKPQNLGIDTTQRTLKILDWGLAEFYFPGKKQNPHAGTRQFKSPEQIIGFPYYTYSIDIWPCGIVFGFMIFGRYLVEAGEDFYDQIIQLSNFTGGEPILELAKDLGIEFDKEMTSQLKAREEIMNFEHYIEYATPGLVTTQSIDLLRKFLVVDFRNRISAADALQHPFFTNPQ